MGIDLHFPTKGKIMGKTEIVDRALQVKTAERYEIDRVWAEEALNRARACDEGRMKTLSFEEVLDHKTSVQSADYAD
jgi:hypothetical protein